MAANNQQQAKVVIDAIRRFPDVSKDALAKYLVRIYPHYFLNKYGHPDKELARGRIRYYTESSGDKNRKWAGIRLKMEMPPVKSVAKVPYHLDPGRWLILSDLQVPFHSQFAIEKAIERGKKEGITGVFLNGDVQDCESLSDFPTPYRRDFLKEVEDTIDMIDFLRQEFIGLPMIWKPGNHEDRLELYYSRNAPALLELPTSDLETVLSLETRGIKYLDRKQKVYAGKLVVLHGHEIRGGNPNLVSPARWLYLRAIHNTLIGHFHKPTEYNGSNIEGKDIFTWSTGCLCDLHPDWNPYANQWKHGFAIVNVESDGIFEVHNYRILKGGQIR